jgi:hypothetical protein
LFGQCARTLQRPPVSVPVSCCWMPEYAAFMTARGEQH